VLTNTKEGSYKDPVEKRTNVGRHDRRSVCVVVCRSGGSPSPYSWDNVIPNTNQRFKVLADFGGAAASSVNQQLAWAVSFGDGSVDFLDKLLARGFAWCVRGPMQESVY